MMRLGNRPASDRFCCNEVRRRGRRISARSQSHEALEADRPDLGPAEEASRAHRHDAVRAAVDASPSPQREALSLAFLDDLNHEQVAAFLGDSGISPGGPETVASVQARRGEPVENRLISGLVAAESGRPTP